MCIIYRKDKFCLYFLSLVLLAFYCSILQANDEESFLKANQAFDEVSFNTRSTPSSSPTGFSEVTFALPAGGVNFQKKNIHETIVFPTALTDAECIELTTL